MSMGIFKNSEHQNLNKLIIKGKIWGEHAWWIISGNMNVYVYIIILQDIAMSR